MAGQMGSGCVQTCATVLHLYLPMAAVPGKAACKAARQDAHRGKCDADVGEREGDLHKEGGQCASAGAQGRCWQQLWQHLQPSHGACLGNGHLACLAMQQHMLQSACMFAHYASMHAGREQCQVSSRAPA